MPSTIVGALSGGVPLVSGNPYSGDMTPYGGVQLRVSSDASGSVYVGVALGLRSGGITITSGGALASGGLSDAMELRPNDAYFVPRLQCSGQLDKIYATVVAGISGRVRLFWEAI